LTNVPIAIVYWHRHANYSVPTGIISNYWTAKTRRTRRKRKEEVDYLLPGRE